MTEFGLGDCEATEMAICPSFGPNYGDLFSAYMLLLWVKKSLPQGNELLLK